MPIKPYIKNRYSIARLFRLCLAMLSLALLITYTVPAQSQTGETHNQPRRYTVARVREDTAQATVAFLESARFYTLMKSNKCYDKYLLILKAAEKNAATVEVSFLNRDSDVIVKVKK